MASAEHLLELNVPELPPANEEQQTRNETDASTSNVVSLDSIWPKHTCGKSETAVGISACSCGAAVGMFVLYGLCNF